MIISFSTRTFFADFYVFLHLHESMAKYVFVDWGKWGVEVKLSTKVVMKDHFNVKEGDTCSIQGTDPETKRPMMFEGEILGVFGKKKDAENILNALVSPPVKDSEKELVTDATRPRREPKPSKKKLEADSENEEPKRKKARKETAAEKGGQLSQVEKEPELTPKTKSSIKKKAANTKAKDTQDAQLISAANTERVQNLLQRREQARTSEVIEIKELEESDSTSKHSRKPHDQPTGPNLAPSLLNQLSTEKQSNGQVTCPPPQQLSNLSTGFQLSSSYKSASPVTTASRFQFSSPSVGSAHSPSHFSLPSSRQVIKSPKLLFSPTACSMQQEFSISESLSHCSDYDDILDLDGPMAYPSRVPSLMPMASSRVSRGDGWQQEMSSFPEVNGPCHNCQPLLQSLSSRLSNLEAEVEKLKRKQKKGKPISENEDAQDTERFNGLTKEALVKSIDDTSDAKTAAKVLAKKLFTREELQKSSVTGFQCNKDYEARPGLSPSRRNLLESIVLRKAFPGSTRSSMRKDLSLVLKKARASLLSAIKPEAKMRVITQKT